MSSHSPILDVLDAADESVCSGLDALLARDAGALAVRVPGRDRSRCRAAVTLLHGNEPSGARAIARLLAERFVPEVDALLVLGALEAARTPPRFGHRFLPGRRDRNRLFSPTEDPTDPDVAFSRELLALVLAAKPEALLDLHNNTGHNPAYGIATQLDAERLGLVSMFAERVIVTDLNMNTLMEAVDTTHPAVSIEVGRSGDSAADQLAYDGLRDFFSRPALPDGREPMTVYRHPMRVELASGVSVGFSPEPRAIADLVFSDELDTHNFNVVSAGTPLGWVNTSTWPLRCRAGDGRELSRVLFDIDAGRLLARRDIVPIMMTVDAVVARQDCLFYVVSEETRVAL